MKNRLQHYWYWAKNWAVFGVCVPIVFTFCLGWNVCQVSRQAIREFYRKWEEA